MRKSKWVHLPQLTQPKDYEIKVQTLFYLYFPYLICNPQSLKVSHWLSQVWVKMKNMSKKSPTGPTERTPKPEYLITL